MYKLVIRKAAAKMLLKMPPKKARKIRSELKVLASSGTPPKAIALQGYEDCYRIRYGDWRVIYRKDGKRLIIEVIRIASRGQAYR